MTKTFVTKPMDKEKIGYNLNTREEEVLKLMTKGKTNSEIAAELNITVHTVKVYVANILQKLVVRDRIQAVIKALSEKLVDI